jgi:hypothetical protein
MPVAAQNRMTRSSALSFVVVFAMAYSPRQLSAKPAIAPHAPAREPYVVWPL